MLRITTDKSADALVLRLEGRLEGPWVAVLARSFRSALPRLRGRRLCVDLNGLTFVDAKGKARLAEMYAQGAELLGDDLETKAIVAEIRGDRADGGADGESRQVMSQRAVANISDELTELGRLQAELHEVNEHLAQAARPLDRLAELNEEQRREVAAKIRAGLARWESVTQRISQVMGSGSANGQATPKGNEGESR
jgi:hypothetical protein